MRLAEHCRVPKEDIDNSNIFLVSIECGHLTLKKEQTTTVDYNFSLSFKLRFANGIEVSSKRMNMWTIDWKKGSTN